MAAAAGSNDEEDMMEAMMSQMRSLLKSKREKEARQLGEEQSERLDKITALTNELEKIRAELDSAIAARDQCLLESKEKDLEWKEKDFEWKEKDLEWKEKEQKLRDQMAHYKQETEGFLQLLQTIIDGNEAHQRSERERRKQQPDIVCQLIQFLGSLFLCLPSVIASTTLFPQHIDVQPYETILVHSLDLYRKYTMWTNPTDDKKRLTGKLSRLDFDRALLDLGCVKDENGAWLMVRFLDRPLDRRSFDRRSSDQRSSDRRSSDQRSSNQVDMDDSDQMTFVESNDISNDVSNDVSKETILLKFASLFEIDPKNTLTKALTSTQLYEIYQQTFTETIHRTLFPSAVELRKEIEIAIRDGKIQWHSSTSKRAGNAPVFFVRLLASARQVESTSSEQPKKPKRTRVAANADSTLCASSASDPLALSLSIRDSAMSTSTSGAAAMSTFSSSSSTFSSSSSTMTGSLHQALANSTQWLQEQLKSAVDSRVTRAVPYLRELIANKVATAVRFYIGRSSNGIRGAEDRFEVHMRERKLSRFEILYRTESLEDSMTVEEHLIQEFRTDPRLDNTLLSGSGGTGQSSPFVVYLAWK